MSKNYDNWGRLVASVQQREKLRQLALCDSLSSSCNSSPSSSFNHGSSSRIDELHLHNISSSIERFEEDNQSGKKSIIVGARKLMISHGENPMYWNWTSHADSRFSEVAQLKCVCWLDIKCKIDTQLLSGKTIYGAYLVHKLANANYGLGSVEGVVRFVNYEADLDAERRADLLHLGRFVRRDDEWMEIELGEFYNDKGEDGEVEARLMDIRRRHWKSGIIIEGIEFRPKKKSFDHIEQFIKSGYLLLPSKVLGLKSWKKRWFFLTRTSLVFFKSDPTVVPQHGGEVNLTLGGIDLHNSGSVVFREDKKLLTVLLHGQTYTVKAETSEDLYEWKTAIEYALALAPRGRAWIPS